MRIDLDTLTARQGKARPFLFSEVVHASHLFHQGSQQVLFLVVTFLINVSEVALVLFLRVD